MGFPGGWVIKNLPTIQKQRHYFANKGLSSQGYGFSCGHVWMWELDYEEGWAPKNWCFWTVVLEKTFESPWTAKRSNQPILKEISPGISLEGMMLKLKLQYFGHLMRRVDSLEKTLMLGGIGARGEGNDRGWDGWMASLTWWTWVCVNSGSGCWTGRPGVLRFMGSQRVGHDWATDLIWSDNSKAPGDVGSVSGSGISPGGRQGHPLKYYCLEKHMDRWAMWSTVTKSWTPLKRLHFKSFHSLSPVQLFATPWTAACQASL